MFKNLAYAILFAVLGVVIQAQSDPYGYALVDGWFGLKLVMIICFLAFAMHICLYIKCILEESNK